MLKYLVKIREKFNTYKKVVSDLKENTRLNQYLGTDCFSLLKCQWSKLTLGNVPWKTLVGQYLGVGQEKPINFPNYN